MSIITQKLQASLLPALLAGIAALLLMAGCTSNNGDIGAIFGQWKLTHIETDGMANPMPEPAMTWAFQSSTVRVLQMAGDEHTWSESYGNFRLDDNTLFLDFADERYPMLIPGVSRQSEWQVLRLDSKRLTVRYQYPDQSEMLWYFTKW